jgi:hypothetical protein
VVAAVFCGTAVPAADAPAKVIRHMTFAATYNFQSTIDTTVSGIGGPASGIASNAGAATDRRSTISVDVVAATADGGLVVDVSETSTPVFRAGISTSELLIPPYATVTEEEQALLPYLARGFVQSDTVSAGATWTTKPSGAASGQTTYTIKSVDEGAHTIAVAISGSSSVTGPNSSDATTTGSMTYDIRKVVPLKLNLTTRTVVSRGDRLVTAIAHIESTLRDDSLPSAPATPLDGGSKT